MRVSLAGVVVVLMGMLAPPSHAAVTFPPLVPCQPSVGADDDISIVGERFIYACYQGFTAGLVEQYNTAPIRMIRHARPAGLYVVASAASSFPEPLIKCGEDVDHWQFYIETRLPGGKPLPTPAGDASWAYHGPVDVPGASGTLDFEVTFSGDTATGAYSFSVPLPVGCVSGLDGAGTFTLPRTSFTAGCVSSCRDRVVSSPLPPQPLPTVNAPAPITKDPLPVKAKTTVLGWRRGRLQVRLACPSGAASPCRVRTRLRVQGSALKRSARVDLAPGRARVLSLRAPRHARRERLILRVTTRTSAGVTTRTIRSLPRKNQTPGRRPASNGVE